MGLFFRFIVRLFIICFALFFALLFASLFVGFGIASSLFPEFLDPNGTAVLESEENETAFLAIFSIVSGIVTGYNFVGSTSLPASIVIAVTEMMRWQGLTTQLILGGIVGLFVMFSGFSIESGVAPAEGTVLVSLATGFVGAFFYWLVAGRNAGAWMGPTPEPEISLE